jgi:hypothetical protein
MDVYNQLTFLLDLFAFTQDIFLTNFLKIHDVTLLDFFLENSHHLKDEILRVILQIYQFRFLDHSFFL